MFLFKAQGGQELNSFPRHSSDNIWLTIGNKRHNAKRRGNFESLLQKTRGTTVKIKGKGKFVPVIN
jgi:hypothetical protein